MHDIIASAKSLLNDRTALLRPAVQFGFVAFSILLGIEFAGFVLSLHHPDLPLRHRPPAVEAYLPISSLMSLTYWFKTGIANTVHPAGLVIFTLTLVLAFVLRRGFCSWICPIGTGAEYAWKTGRLVLGRNLTPPKWIDWPLRSLKYLLLGFFLYHILLMPAAALGAFIHGPYNRIADVKMLLFFRCLSLTGAMVILVLGVLSVLIKNFWCRCLCPYGALLGLFSALSPTAVRRDSGKCVSCGRCAKACPNRIAVDTKETVRSTLCTACFSCIRACKIPGALEISPRQKRLRLSLASYALITILALFLTAQVAKSLHYWHSETTPDQYRSLYLNISQIDHP